MAAKFLIVLLLALSAVPRGPGNAMQDSQAVGLEQVLVNCAGSGNTQVAADPAEGRPAFPLGLAPGIEATALGALPAQAMPPGIDASLGFGRLLIAAQGESVPRVAAGPLLFVVESGTLEILVNFAPTHRVANTSLLVERGQIYAIANPGSEPASMLVAGVEPPEGLISAYGDKSIWTPLAREQESIVRERLAEAAVEYLRQEETLMFLGCMTWTDGNAEFQNGNGYPGPVALLVLQGQVEITTAAVDRLTTGMCAVIPRYTAFRAASVDEPAAVLVMGALPVSELNAVATPQPIREGTRMIGSTATCSGFQPTGEPES